MDEQFVKAMMAQQGIDVPAGHWPDLAANAAALAATATALEARLEFGSDIHGFTDFLAKRSEESR